MGANAAAPNKLRRLIFLPVDCATAPTSVDIGTPSAECFGRYAPDPVGGSGERPID
jgi:hypothetical protein